MNLALQRRLPEKDSNKWRTVHRFRYEEAVEVLEGATRMGKVGRDLHWRVVVDDEFQKALLYWTRSAGWVIVVS